MFVPLPRARTAHPSGCENLRAIPVATLKIPETAGYSRATTLRPRHDLLKRCGVDADASAILRTAKRRLNAQLALRSSCRGDCANGSGSSAGAESRAYGN